MNWKPSLSLVLIAALTGCAGVQIDPMITATHISDVTRNYPEPTTDYIGVGATLRWRQLEVDISHGVRSRDCSAMRGGDCAFESGTAISTRYYLRRRH